MRWTLEQRDVVRHELEGLADEGVTIGAIDSQLASIPLRATSTTRCGCTRGRSWKDGRRGVVVQAGDWYGYAPVEGG